MFFSVSLLGAYGHLKKTGGLSILHTNANFETDCILRGAASTFGIDRGDN